MQMTHYIAVLIPSDNGEWRALMPDLPECVGYASDPAAAKLAAANELERRIRGNGFMLPRPRDLSAIAIDHQWMSRHDIDLSRAVVTFILAGGHPCASSDAA
jgi:hypothetical protein